MYKSMSQMKPQAKRKSPAFHHGCQATARVQSVFFFFSPPIRTGSYSRALLLLSCSSIFYGMDIICRKHPKCCPGKIVYVYTTACFSRRSLRDTVCSCTHDLDGKSRKAPESALFLEAFLKTRWYKRKWSMKPFNRAAKKTLVMCSHIIYFFNFQGYQHDHTPTTPSFLPSTR